MSDYDLISSIDLFKIARREIAHAAPGAAVSTADATDESTALSLATDLRAAMVAHFADEDAHSAADSVTDLPAEEVATHGNLSVFVAGLAGALADHCQRGDVHFGPDADNQRTDVHPTPTETATWRRLNAVKAAWNAHLASAMASTPAE